MKLHKIQNDILTALGCILRLPLDENLIVFLTFECEENFDDFV